jgi:hypothetical protein
VLTTLAGACRDHERLRFDYRSYDGTSAIRSVEPHRLVTWGRKWYLVAWDTDRGDWRTFRVDRVEPRTPTGPRFTPRELPEGGRCRGLRCARRVVGGRPVSGAGHRTRPRRCGRCSHHPAVGVVNAIDDYSCMLATGADRVETVAVYLGLLDVDFEVTEPPELVVKLRVLSDRYRRAVRS